jgi:hypothetical protein
MAYKVINSFRDATDKNRVYKEGDEFPAGDSKPSKKRIEELSKQHPKYKRSFIEEVKEKREVKEKSKKKSKKDKE